MEKVGIYMLIDKSLKDYILQTSSANPTPGGGSVSALAGSLGSALTQMVGNLTFDKKSYEGLDQDKKLRLQDDFKLLEEKTEVLSKIIDEDSNAFDEVMLAFKMPKSNEEEVYLRNRAIEAGYKKALEVPLRCAEECLNVLGLQLSFAEYGNINAITDVGVGALLGYSGLEGALLNVKINLLGIKDEEYKISINEKISILYIEGNRLKEDILNTVYDRLNN